MAMKWADAKQAAVESHKASLIMSDNFHFELAFVLFKAQVIDATGSQFAVIQLAVLFYKKSLPSLPTHYLLVRKHAANAILVDLSLEVYLKSEVFIQSLLLSLQLEPP
jgi:hypothetical protein